MPRNLANILVCVLVGGCAAPTERRPLGYGDYAGYSCEQLGQEAARLLQQRASRNEHIFEDDQSRRDVATRQLKAVKQVIAEKRC